MFQCSLLQKENAKKKTKWDRALWWWQSIFFHSYVGVIFALRLMDSGNHSAYHLSSAMTASHWLLGQSNCSSIFAPLGVRNWLKNAPSLDYYSNIDITDPKRINISIFCPSSFQILIPLAVFPHKCIPRTNSFKLWSPKLAQYLTPDESLSSGWLSDLFHSTLCWKIRCDTLKVISNSFSAGWKVLCNFPTNLEKTQDNENWVLKSFSNNSSWELL